MSQDLHTSLAPSAWTGSTPARVTSTEAPLLVGWVRHLDELREAQMLRFKVFGDEMGATLDTPLADHDVDEFDDHCEHLIVREPHSLRVVGTYRVLTPTQARKAGGFYTDREFDLAPLAAWRDQCVEMGRSCVHADWRSGNVILTLWRELAAFMASQRLPGMIGCASMPMNWPGVHRHGAAAATIWQQLRKHVVAPEMQVRPHHPLPVDALLTEALHVSIEPPPLLRGYLRLGAELMGPPAWDAQFNCADVPIHLHIDQLAPRYRRMLGLCN